MRKEEETQVKTIEPVETPAVAVDRGAGAVMELIKILDQKKKKVVIGGERYMEFEDWILLANLYGLTVRTGDPEPVQINGIEGVKASAEVLRTEDGVVIGGATAYVMRDEKNWKNKPFFQLASMAQTRAGSKALSNLLRGFVALKGIKGTPAEEMTTPTPAERRKNKIVTETPAEEPEPEPVPPHRNGEITRQEIKDMSTEQLGRWAIGQIRDVDGPITGADIGKVLMPLRRKRWLSDKKFNEVKVWFVDEWMAG